MWVHHHVKGPPRGSHIGHQHSYNTHTLHTHPRQGKLHKLLIPMGGTNASITTKVQYKHFQQQLFMQVLVVLTLSFNRAMFTSPKRKKNSSKCTHDIRQIRLPDKIDDSTFRVIISSFIPRSQHQYQNTEKIRQRQLYRPIPIHQPY